MFKQHPPSDRPNAPAPIDTRTSVSPAGGSTPRWIILAVGALLFVLLRLQGVHKAIESFDGHSIPLYPGMYERVVFDSGKTVSAAMQAVYLAPDEAASTRAIAVVRRMVESGEAQRGQVRAPVRRHQHGTEDPRPPAHHDSDRRFA